MKHGNVLVIGNSGVGKSTLINAVLGENVAETSYGTTGTTKVMKIYSSDQIPFRIIDTVGFEPTFFKTQRAIKEVNKWSKNSAKEGNENSRINVIWFCIDGTSSKLFEKNIHDLMNATKIWPTVPIIAVITKSFSSVDRPKNIDLVRKAFSATKYSDRKPKKIIPVVAGNYYITETNFASVEGISELITETNTLMPEGIRASEQDAANYILKRKRTFAQTTVSTCVVAGTAIGATPIPIADSIVLSALEASEIKALASIYGIKKDDKTKDLFQTIIELGAATGVAKTAISTLKAIPGLNLAAIPLNATVAGGIVATIGEICIYVFEQIYLGKKDVTDTEWVAKLIESKVAESFIEKCKNIVDKINDNSNSETIAELIKEVFLGKKGK